MTSNTSPPSCDDARHWLSAHLDGEAPRQPGQRQHIATCAPCKSWWAELDDLPSAALDGPTPDLISPAVAHFRSPELAGSSTQTTVGRWLLGAAGVLGVALAAVGVWTVRDVLAPAGAHLGTELYAFEAAVSIGLLLAAHRPERYGRSVTPIVLVVALLTALPASGLVGPAVGVLAEASHIPVLMGLMGLFVIHTADSPRRPSPEGTPA